ncbi:MAG: hypothetical protein ACI8QC_003063 [Planctomycetota bacterium]|jgi:hypothetical protein
MKSFHLWTIQTLLLSLAGSANGQVHQPEHDLLLPPVLEPLDGFARGIVMNDDVLAVADVLLLAPTGDRRGGVQIYRSVNEEWIHTQTLFANDHQNVRQFGSRMLLAGDELFVSVPQYSTSAGFSFGAVYVFQDSPGGWIQTQKLTGSLTHPYEAFGLSIAVDGDSLVIGTPSHEFDPVNSPDAEGIVYEFERTSNGWQEIGFIEPTFLLHPYGRFGTSLALDGDTLVVGDLSEGTPPSFLNGHGAAWIFARSSTGWDLRVRLTPPSILELKGFGHGVQLHQGRLFVSSPAVSYSQVAGFGMVRMYDQSGPPAIDDGWQLQQTISGSDGSNRNFFGQAFEVHGDWLFASAMRASYPQSEVGGGYLFKETAAGWVEASRLLPVTSGRFFGSHAAFNGSVVALGSGDGSLLPGNSGRVAFFRRPVEFANECLAVPNSSGQSGKLFPTGSQTATDNDFVLVASALPEDSFGMVLVGRDPALLLGAYGSLGILCLDPMTLGMVRQSVRVTGEAGFMAMPVDLSSVPTNPVQSILAGETWRFQVWYRDKIPNHVSNMTEAISITFE